MQQLDIVVLSPRQVEIKPGIYFFLRPRIKLRVATPFLISYIVRRDLLFLFYIRDQRIRVELHCSRFRIIFV